MPAINIPAYCSECNDFFPSGFVVDNVIRATFENNYSNCPKGHTTKVIDGTFNALNGVLEIVKMGDVTAEHIEKLIGLSAQVKSNKISPEDALSEVYSTVTAELARVIKDIPNLSPTERFFVCVATISAAYKATTSGTLDLIQIITFLNQ